MGCDGDVEKGGITVDREPVLQHLIPNVWQLVLAKVPVLGRVIDCEESGLLYVSGDALGLPIHYGKTVQLDGMTCGVGMVINRGGSS